MIKMADETKQDKPKTQPAWEIFIVGEDGEILKKEFTNKTTGKTGMTWDKRGALWENTAKEGTTYLSGSMTLANGQEVKLRLFPPRGKKA
jgi:hypothetical protein